MGNDCIDKPKTSIPRYLQECQPEQNYGDNFYFCKYQTGTGPWSTSNTRCEPKPS